MSQNTHTGVSNNRRPVNRTNGKKRIRQSDAVLAFLKSRETKTK